MIKAIITLLLFSYNVYCICPIMDNGVLVFSLDKDYKIIGKSDEYCIGAYNCSTSICTRSLIKNTAIISLLPFNHSVSCNVKSLETIKNEYFYPVLDENPIIVALSASTKKYIDNSAIKCKRDAKNCCDIMCSRYNLFNNDIFIGIIATNVDDSCIPKYI